jgi:hypothetical protein
MSLGVRSVSVCAALVWLWVGCSAGAKTSGSDGGAAGGGNATSSGGSSAGGASTGGTTTGGCGITECFRAVECVLACGQEPVSVGCCPCTAPAFDSIQCSSGTGGASNGGATSSGGTTSSGGSGSCAIQECLRAVACVLGCGQEPVSVSCCPCEAPAFDSIACQGTGGVGSGGTSSGGTGGKATGGSGGALCGDSVCATGQACACGGPGGLLQCACGDVCKTNADCGGDQPVCCGGVCTTACLCFCD